MNLLLWGKGGHAAVVQQHAAKYQTIANIDDSDPRVKNLTDLFSPEQWDLFIAVGDNCTRERIYRHLNETYNIISIISPFAYVSPSARLGPGCFIGPMCCVQARAQLHDGVIINTGATVDHDCIIGGFVHIAPGCHICGNVNVGEGTLIGVGTSIIPKIKIGSKCIIAGGSSVNRDCDRDNYLYVGNPVQPKRSLATKD